MAFRGAIAVTKSPPFEMTFSRQEKGPSELAPVVSFLEMDSSTFGFWLNQMVGPKKKKIGQKKNYQDKCPATPVATFSHVHLFFRTSQNNILEPS